MTGLRPFAIIKAPASGAVNAEATSLSRRPTRPQANEDVGRIIRRGLRGFRPEIAKFAFWRDDFYTSSPQNDMYV